MEELGRNSTLSEQIGKLFSDSFTVIQEPGDPVVAANAEDASALAGFTVRLPANRADAPTLTVQGSAAFEFTVDRDRAQAILNDAGLGETQLPASLDGAPIAVSVPASVSAAYGGCPDPNAAPDEEGDTPIDNLTRNQIYNFLTMAGLYAINFLTIVMSALISADTLAGEIGSGTMQSLVTKPIRRVDVVLGKWLGFAGLLALYLLLMIGGVLTIVFALSSYSPPNIARGAPIVYLESLLVMTITLACSSAFSTLATGGIVFGLYGLAFIGGFVEQIGAVLKNQVAVNIGIISSLILPSESLLRRASYEMTSPLAQSFGFNAGPLIVVSIPSPAMIVYAALYLLTALAFAIRQFSRRDL